MIGGPVAIIRPDALEANLQVVRALAPNCRVLAVVKANAYGHGLVPVARALAGADGFAVARIEEGLQLRQDAIAKRIVILGGAIDRDDVEAATRAGLDLVIHSAGQLTLLEASQGIGSIDVWLKIDSGMGRLGIAPDEAQEAILRLKSLAPNVRAIRLMTHFANADRPEDPTTIEQLECFGNAIGEWTGDVSLSNSAAVMGWPMCAKPSSKLHYAGENWVRPGLMLYGVAPVASDLRSSNLLRPAMFFETRVLAVKSIARGRPVGYGGDWRAARDTRLGILAAGYGDGYPWQKSVATSVRIGQRTAPLVGRVSMDLVAVDLTDAQEAGVGARVMLWGDEPSVSEVAGLAGRIPYDLLCGVSPRVPRRYLEV